MDRIEEEPEWTKCRSCYLKFNDCVRSPMILPCSHRICLLCHNEQWVDSHDNPSVECPYCRSRFHRQETEATLKSYHPIKDMALSMALNSIEMAKIKRQQAEGERASLIERHTAELAENKNLLAEMAEKVMSDARTINHFYNT